MSSKAAYSISHSPWLIREAASTVDVRVRSPRLDPSTNATSCRALAKLLPSCVSFSVTIEQINIVLSGNNRDGNNNNLQHKELL